jgi:cytochrome c553
MTEKFILPLLRHKRFPCLLILGLSAIVCGYVLYGFANRILPSEEETYRAAGEQLALYGRRDVLACANCHGTQGQGDFDNAVPRLAGLNAEHIIKQLQDFARDPIRTRVVLEPISRDYTKTPKVNVDLTVYTPGTRHHETMNAVAKSLTAEETRNLALYYSSLAFTATPIPYDFETLARGEDLALRGKPEYGVPACISCHGPENEGFGPQFPPLAGQPPQYLINQINNWQNGKRDNDHLALMRNVSNQLTDGDKVNLAAYLSNLSYQVNVE